MLICEYSTKETRIALKNCEFRQGISTNVKRFTIFCCKYAHEQLKKEKILCQKGEKVF